MRIISRRRLLAYASKFSAQALLFSFFWDKAFAQADLGKTSLFKLGVASGEPEADGMVLWTRLAPRPTSRRGGMPNEPVKVVWEIAKDSDMSTIVRRGVATAQPDMGHSVHVEVDGLEADHWYWYRFKVGSEYSPIGRTRTAPAAGSRVESVKFAVACCQHFEQGYFTAHRHMAAENIHFVLFLGDYIYERQHSKRGHVRYHGEFEATTLDEYRERYAQYKSDPDLQACHAAFPWIVTWDDHEVANNYAGSISPKDDDRDSFLRRRAAAYQAYYENMPLRRSFAPKGADMMLYRRLKFGNLLEVNILDTRQYRTVQPCDRGFQECEGAANPKATILGDKQEKWLYAGLQNSKAKWNVVAQQVPMFQHLHHKGKRRINADKWDGYIVSRKRLLDFLSHHKTSNPIVLSGDVHANLVSDLKLDFDDPSSTTVGSEFVATSISSGGNGKNRKKRARKRIAANPHIKYFDKRRGYLLCEVTQDRWKTDIRQVKFVEEKGAPIKTRASFEVKNGVPGVVSI